jgi:hypothetical protein
VDKRLLEDILEKKDQILDVMNMIKGIISYINDAIKPDDESIVDNKVILNSKIYETRANNSVIELMLNLLNIAYCPIANELKTYRDQWEHDIIHVYRNDLVKLFKWGMDNQDDELINNIDHNINDLYKGVIILFEKRYKNQSKINIIIDSLPTHCPWSLRELLDYEIDDLLSQIDDFNI